MADSMEGRLNCVDLFAGAGGFSLGFQEAGFDIVAAVDRSESALATYNHNLEGVQTIEADLQQVSPEEVVDKIGIAPDKVDVIIGGPPCKGFSTAGKMDSGNSKNSLVANYIGIVSGIQPQLVVMENVTGILSMEGGAYKERIIGGFRQEGFQISDNPIVLNAADFGVPQRRNRVFFLATRHDEIEPPKPTHYDPSLDPIARPETAEKPWVALEDAIGDLSFLQYGEEAEEYKLRPLSEYQKAIRCVNSSQLTNHKATNGSNNSDMVNRERTSPRSIRPRNTRYKDGILTNLLRPLRLFQMISSIMSTLEHRPFVSLHVFSLFQTGLNSRDHERPEGNADRIRSPSIVR
jgi:DNA (cytosine-5)-methyltransferase 1